MAVRKRTTQQVGHESSIGPKEVPEAQLQRFMAKLRRVPANRRADVLESIRLITGKSDKPSSTNLPSRDFRTEAIGLAAAVEQQVKILRTLFSTIERLSEQSSDRQIHELAKHGSYVADIVCNDVSVFGENASVDDGSANRQWRDHGEISMHIGV